MLSINAFILSPIAPNQKNDNSLPWRLNGEFGNFLKMTNDDKKPEEDRELKWLKRCGYNKYDEGNCKNRLNVNKYIFFSFSIYNVIR